MSLLQIDTINIVARSPLLVLFSRLGAWSPHWLEDALARGELMEYWAHEACFMPRSDFRLIRHRMLRPEKMGWKYHADWMQEHAEDIARLLAHIEQHGPVRSADFSHPQTQTGGWWAWKPHKRHLEGLFTTGQLMVVARHNFQLVYDLTSRVMPEWDDARHLPSEETAIATMLENSARSLGIFLPEWLADYYRLRRVDAAAWIARWQHDGTVVPVQVEKMGTMWLHRQWLPELALAQQGKLNATHSAVLSPFDPLVWDRRRVLQFFAFDYRLECYTPAPKRRYGYFVLPLLCRGALVGRMDAKMHRKAHMLEIIALYLEDGVNVTASLMRDLQAAINDFARWQGATRVSAVRLPEALRSAWGAGWESAPPQSTL